MALATEIDALHASFLSIANIGLPTSDADPAVLMPLSSRPSLLYSRRGASMVIMAVDVAMALGFVFFSLALRWILNAASRRIRFHAAKASDYAVYVTGLPKNATEAEVSIPQT